MIRALKGLSSPSKIVEAGERIYSEHYKAEFERDRFGQFVAIDISTGEAYPAEFPEEALLAARAKAPTGVFHLIRIGFPGAFKLSTSAGPHVGSGGLFRRRR